MAARLGLTALGLASLAGYALDLHALFGRELRVLAIYVALFAALSVLYLAAVGIALRSAAGDRVALGLVLGFALLFRIVVLPAPVVLSSDLYRYLWDGRVQRAGISPYRYAPAAPELAALRDDAIHPNINRPTKRTVYPPGAQAVFALAAAAAPDSVVGWRAGLLVVEVATVALLLVLLRRMRRPAIAVVVYAWAPLAVFEGVQAAHVDMALLPALLVALLWRQQGRMAHAGAALGVATLVKLYPAVLALAWWRRGDRRLPLAWAAVVLAGYLAYGLPVGAGVLGFLPEYFGRAEDFNIGLRFFVTSAIGLDGPGARAIAMGGLFAALLAALLRIRHRLTENHAGVFDAGMAAVGAYLLLVPTALYAWYAVWMLPFLAVAPSPAWLWFTGAITLSYLAYAWHPEPFPFWARALEFGPLYGLLLRDWWRRRGRVMRGSASPGSSGALGHGGHPCAGNANPTRCRPGR
jgi:hypothetical protein